MTEETDTQGAPEAPDALPKAAAEHLKLQLWANRFLGMVRGWIGERDRHNRLKLPKSVVVVLAPKRTITADEGKRDRKGFVVWHRVAMGDASTRIAVSRDDARRGDAAVMVAILRGVAEAAAVYAHWKGDITQAKALASRVAECMNDMGFRAHDPVKNTVGGPVTTPNAAAPGSELADFMSDSSKELGPMPDAKGIYLGHGKQRARDASKKGSKSFYRLQCAQGLAGQSCYGGLKDGKGKLVKYGARFEPGEYPGDEKALLLFGTCPTHGASVTITERAGTVRQTEAPKAAAPTVPTTTADTTTGTAPAPVEPATTTPPNGVAA